MKMMMFSVFDSKACTYNTPFFMNTIGEAVRGFTDVTADPQTSISKHPEDYALYALGVIDYSDGSFEPYSPPKNLGNASNYVAIKPVAVN